VVRVLLPAFAGISRLPFWRTAIPLAIASAVWYGVLLLAGIFTSRNLPRMLSIFAAFNTWLLIATIVLLGGLVILWWRSRRERRGPDE
jgi:membrane protein DedA with SNARE-associated domain